MPKIRRVMCFFILRYLIHVIKCEKKSSDADDFGPIPTRHETKWSQFFIIGSQNTGKQNSNGYFYHINPNHSSGHQILPFNRYTRDPTLADQEGSSMFDQRNSNAKLQNFNPRQRFQDHLHVRTFQENFQRIVPATRSNSYLNYDLQDSTQANPERESNIATTFEYLRTTSAPLIKINNKSKKYTELSNQNIGHRKVNTESSHIFPNQQTGFQLKEKDTNFRRAPVILNEKRSSKPLPFNNSTDFLRIFNFQNVPSASPVPVNKRINRHRELSDENINHQNAKIEFTRLSQNPQAKLQLEEKDTTSRYASVILKEKKPCISFSCISNLTDFSRIKKISGRRNISQIVFTNNNSRPMVSLTAKETENEPEIVFLRNAPRSSLKNTNTAQSVQPVSNSNVKISLKYGTNLKFHKNDTKLEDNIQPYLATRNSHKFGSKKFSSTNPNENITDNLAKTAPFQNKSPRYDFTTSASERPLTSITDLLFYPRSSTVIESPEFDKLEESPNFFDPSTEPTFGQRIKSTNQFSKSNVNRGTFDQKQTTLDSFKTNNQFSPFSDKFENNLKRQQYEQSLAELNRTIFSLFWNSERLPVHKDSDALVLKNDAKLKNIKENREINSTNSEIKNDALKKSPEFQLFVNPENNDKKAKTHSTGDELYESEDNFEKINIMNHTAKEETEKHNENSNDNVDRQPQSYSFQSYRTPNLEVERENNPSQSSSLEQPADYDYHKAHSKPTDRTKYESNSPLTRYIKDSKDTVLKLKVHLLPLSKNETSGKSDSESKSETIHHLHVFTNVFEKFPPYQIQSYYAPVQQYYIPPSHYHYPKYSYIPIPHSKNQNQFTLIAPSLQEWKQHELTKIVKPVVKKEEPLTTHLDNHFTNSFPFSKNAEKTEPITEAVTIPSFEDKSSRVLRTTNKKLEKVREKEESDPTAATLSSGSHNQMFHFGLSGSFKPIINIIGAKVSGEVNTEGKKFRNEYHTETGNYPTDEIPTTYSKVKNDKISTSHSLEEDLSHLVTDNATSETSDMIKSEMNSYFATKISTIAKQQNDLPRNLSSNKIAAFQFMYPKYMNSTIFTNKLPVTNTTTSSLHYTSTMNPEETLLSFGIRSPQANIQKRNKTELPFQERAINLFENITQLHDSSVLEMININQTKCAHNTFLSTTNDNSTNPTHLRKKELELAEYNSSTLNSQSIVNVIRNESDEIRCMKDTAADVENSTIHDDIEQSINETNKMFKITSPIENIQDEIEFAATTPMNAFQKDAEFTTRADEITTLFMTTTFPDDYSKTQENTVNNAPSINTTVLPDESMFNYNNGTDLNEAYIIINSTEYIVLENASNYVTASTFTENLNMQLDKTGIHPYNENKSIEKINETEYSSNFEKKSNITNENLFKQTTGIEHSEIEDEFRSKALKDFSSSERIIVTNKTEQKDSIHDNRTAQETDTLNISVDINTNRNQSLSNTSLDQLKNSSPKAILEISNDKNPATERDEILSKIKNDYFLEKNDSTHTIEKDKYIKREMMDSLTKLTEKLISSENSSIEISKAITDVKSQNISNFKDSQKGAKEVDSKTFINLFSNLPRVQNTGATEAYELLTELNTLATSASDSTNKSEKVSSYSSTDSHDNSKNKKDLLVP
ncbi:uncharacterized protein TNCT_104531 [Trichonephila clavata]|uniref:Uncharacterized protein n=1 Tax=Trichonephila clavata TaxID=2740835 RepID=A0A8X6FU47_TRICU|nr:uncharacterized protein TNCT_104531 [Trichonephila clavata]